jgi:hypothetical protein
VEPNNQKQRRYWQGIELDPGEEPVDVIHKHPIGILFIGLLATIVIASIIALLAFTIPEAFSDDRSGSVFEGLMILVLLNAFISLLMIYIYRQNKILITDIHLAEISQKSLVNRKISQLSMANVEDTNAEQRGILSTMFGYGTLTVQTAGEMDNFIFTFCPTPQKYAEEILEAHQAYAQSLQEGNENQQTPRPNQPQQLPEQPVNPPQQTPQ